MKQFTIEEKAKRFDEAIEKLRRLHDNYDTISTLIDIKEELENIFPEFKESEDEKIRKEILVFMNKLDEQGYTDSRYPSWVTWLEKQGEKDNNEDLNLLQRFSFYSYKDEPNILYLAGLYVNEGCRNKGIGTKILEVADEVAKSLNCHTIRLKTKKDSNAERLYRKHGYSSLASEENNEIWLEKQKPVDKIRK